MILNVFITACRGTFKARVALLMRRKTGARCGKVANELAERNLVSPQTTGIYCSERASTDIILPKSKLKKAEGDALDGFCSSLPTERYFLSSHAGERNVPGISFDEERAGMRGETNLTLKEVMTPL